MKQIVTDADTRSFQCQKHIQKVKALYPKACLNQSIELAECAEEFENFCNRQFSLLDILAKGIIHFYGGNEESYFPKKMKCSDLKKHKLFGIYGSKKEVQSFFKDIKTQFFHLHKIGVFNNLAKHNIVIRANNLSKLSFTGTIQSFQQGGIVLENCYFENCGEMVGNQYDNSDFQKLQSIIGGIPVNSSGLKSYSGNLVPQVTKAYVIVENKKNNTKYDLLLLMEDSQKQIDFIIERFKHYFT